MIIAKTVITILVLLFVGFLWLTSIELSRPSYNKMHNVWEEDKAARQLSNIAIAVMLMIMFTLGYLSA
jgi:type IV secretory pathway component VirB8